MLGHFHVDYYWSVFQSEWAIDVVFREADLLRRLYPKIVHHAMTTLGSQDVLRFLGRFVPASSAVPRRFSGEVLSDLKQRAEGIRVKHGVNRNTVKAYDKAFTAQGSVLRFETTIHNGEDFRVCRPKEGDPDGPRSWRMMRRGIADLHRRAVVSHTVEELTRRLEQPVCWKGKRVRGLRVFDSADRQLLEAVNRGKFTINGLRNRDLQRLTFANSPASDKERRRRSAWASRKLRLLRAHGLLQKVPGTHRYHVTKTGRRIITAILTAARATVAQLTALAA
jgi:hypothetical protein